MKSVRTRNGTNLSFAYLASYPTKGSPVAMGYQEGLKGDDGGVEKRCRDSEPRRRDSETGGGEGSFRITPVESVAVNRPPPNAVGGREKARSIFSGPILRRWRKVKGTTKFVPSNRGAWQGSHTRASGNG